MAEPKVTLAQLRAAAKAAGFDGKFNEAARVVPDSIVPRTFVVAIDISGGESVLVATRRSKQRARKLMLRVLKGMA